MLERREMAHRETGSVHMLIMGITGWRGGGVFPLNVVCSLNTLFLLALTERLGSQMHSFIYKTVFYTSPTCDRTYNCEI
jgi:hypothetical protein